MKFLGTSLLPRVLFLLTVFGVSSAVAFVVIRSRQVISSENSVESRVIKASPLASGVPEGVSDRRSGESTVEASPDVFAEENSNSSEPTPDSTSSTVEPTPTLFSQIVSGINTVAQLVISGKSSLTYQGGTANPGSINANLLEGSNWSNPPTIGSETANSSVFTNVTMNGAVTAKGPVTMSQFANGFLMVNGIGEVSASRVSLSNSSQVADRLPTASGGTGNDFSNTATGSVVSFSSPGQMTAIGPGTSGYVLTSNGAGAIPTWVAAGAASVDWTTPGTIGSATPNSGRFIRVDAAGDASPLNIGSTAQLKVDNNGRMTIVYSGDSGSLNSSGGVIFLNQTSNIGTGIGIYSNAGAEAQGNMINVKVDNPNYGQAAFYMNYDGNSNAVEITSNADDDSSNALAVTGNNIQDSTVGIIGYELGRGTIKVSHYRPGLGTDSNASGISIDLKGVGTRAQGLYVDSTESGGTLGNLLRLRNETIDKFVVNYQGNLATAGNITQGAAGTDTVFTKQGNNSNDQFFVGTNGAFRVQRSATASEAFRVQVAGDSQGRWLGTSDGQLKWGPGNATQDTTLVRSGVGALSLTGSLAISGTTTLGGTAYTWPGSIGGNGYILTTTTGGTLTWTDPSTLGAALWQRNSGVLSPTTLTDTLALGTTTPLGTTAFYITKSSATNALAILNQTGSGDIIAASASGTSVFTVANNGNTNVGGSLTSTGNFLASANITQGANGVNTTITKNGNVVGDEFVVGTNGAFRVQRSASGSEAFRTQVVGDTQGRWLGTSDGQLKWGSGALTQDVILRRGVAGVLFLDGTITINNLNASTDTVIKGNADNNLVYVDSTGNRVGIGTSAPLAGLHINKNAGTLPGFMVNQAGTGNLIVASSSGVNKFTVANNGDTAVGGTLTSTGLLTASAALSVTGTTTFGGTAYTWPGSIGGNGYILATTTGGTLSWTDPASLGTNYFQRNSGVLSPATITDSLSLGTTTPLLNSSLYVSNSSFANALTVFNQTGSGDIFTASASGTTKVVIASSGSVGVGAVSPKGIFDINGGTGTTQYFHNTASGALASDGAYIDFASNLGLAFYNQENGPLSFGTNNQERGRFSNTGNFGIGTSSPLAPLHVAGAYGGNAAAIIDQLNGGDIFAASSSGTTRFTISNAGNVTIGANGMDTTFTKQGNTTGDQFFIGTNGAFRAQRSSANSEAFGLQVNGDSQRRLLGTSDGRLKWGAGNATQDIELLRNAANQLALNGAIIINNSNATANTIIKGNADSNLLFVDATGNRVGIGTSTPVAGLHINKDTGTLPGFMVNQLNATADIMTASVSGTTRMVMKSDGSIGLGTLNPTYRVDALETANQLVGFRSQNTNSGNAAAAAIGFAADNHAATFIAFSSGFTGGGALSHFAGRAALLTDLSSPGNGFDYVSSKANGDHRWYAGGFGTGSERMRLVSGGGLVIGGTDPGTNKLKVFGDFEVTGACTGCSSDERLKKNILQLDGSSLEKLLSIKGVTYEWSDAGRAHDYPGLQVGVIAQDVEKVYPELVGTDAAGFKFVRYDKLIGPTIEAIREQQGEITSIDAKVNGLNGGVNQNLSALLSWVDNKWSVISEVIFTKTVNFKDKVTFAAATVFQGKAAFEKPLAQAKDAAGSVVLPSGQQSVSVVFTTAYENAPYVNVTPVGKGVTGFYIDEATKTGFTLKVEQSLSQDVQFNWSAVMTTEGAVLDVTAPTSSPSPTPASSPTASASPSASPVATPVASPSASPSASPTVSPLPTVTPSPVVSPSPSASPTL